MIHGTFRVDVWIGVDPENLLRDAQALALFGAPPRLVSDLRTLGPEQVLYKTYTSMHGPEWLTASFSGSILPATLCGAGARV